MEDYFHDSNNFNYTHLFRNDNNSNSIAELHQDQWGDIYDIIDDGNTNLQMSKYNAFMHYQNKRKIVFGVILITLIIVGIIGNVLVIFASLRKTRRVNSAFYIFLVNSCVASLVLLVFEYPLLLYENVFTQPWRMGKFFCQLHGYIQYCAFYGVAYALVLVLIFRLLQLIVPDRISQINNTCMASVMCTIKWTVIVIANIPTWIGHGLYEEIEGSSFCYHKQLNENKHRLHSYLIVHFIFAFTLPVIIMTAISVILVLTAMKLQPGSHYGNIGESSQLQRNTTIMLVCLIAAFILCWGPTNIFILLLGFDYLDFDDFLPLSIMSDIFMIFACANPCINPWLIFVALYKELPVTCIIDASNNNTAQQNRRNGDAVTSFSNGELPNSSGNQHNQNNIEDNTQEVFTTKIEMDMV